MYKSNLTRKEAMAALSTVAIITIAKGQSICQSDDQCDIGYYCDELISTCNKCVTCENFEERDSCAKTISDCGSLSDCLDGYRYTKEGRCVPSSITPTVIVTAVSITVAVVVIVAGAVHMLCRKRFVSYIDPERGAVQPARPTAPMSEAEYSVGPPTYNDHYFGRSYRPITCSETMPMISNPDAVNDVFAVGYADKLQQENLQRAILSNPPRYDTISPSVTVNPPTEEVQEEPPPPEDIPLHDRNTETQDSNGEEFIEHNQTTSQQPSMQFYVTINNTNTVSTVSTQAQEQYNN